MGVHHGRQTEGIVVVVAVVAVAMADFSVHHFLQQPFGHDRGRVRPRRGAGQQHGIPRDAVGAHRRAAVHHLSQQRFRRLGHARARQRQQKGVVRPHVQLRGARWRCFVSIATTARRRPQLGRLLFPEFQRACGIGLPRFQDGIETDHVGLHVVVALRVQGRNATVQFLGAFGRSNARQGVQVEIERQQGVVAHVEAFLAARQRRRRWRIL